MVQRVATATGYSLVSADFAFPPASHFGPHRWELGVGRGVSGVANYRFTIRPPQVSSRD